jgi:hypothetical protein
MTTDRLAALDRRVLGPYKPLTLVGVRNLLATYVVAGGVVWYVDGAESVTPILMGALTGLTVSIFASTLGRAGRDG